MNAERIKLSTIRSPLWSGIAAAVCSLGIAAMQGDRVRRGKPAAGERRHRGCRVRRPGVDGARRDDRDGRVPQRDDPCDVHRQPEPHDGAGGEGGRRRGVFGSVYVAADGRCARRGAHCPRRWSARSCRWPMRHVAGGRRDGAATRRWRRSSASAVGALLRHTAGAVAVLLLWPLVIEPIVGEPARRRFQSPGPTCRSATSFVFTGVRLVVSGQGCRGAGSARWCTSWWCSASCSSRRPWWSSRRDA